MSGLTQQAIRHTLHCLLGCSIGEILGMVIAEWRGWSNLASIIVAICLAFFFGYLLTFQSVFRQNKNAKESMRITFATDTVSIISMETIDNLFILLIPGALAATLSDGLFWWSLLASLVVAFILTVPVNRFMLARNPHNSHH